MRNYPLSRSVIRSLMCLCESRRLFHLEIIGLILLHLCFLPIFAEIFQLKDLQPEEIAVLQYDNRLLQTNTYWDTAARYNRLYCLTHGHVYIYYSLSEGENCHIGGEELASPWCKVKAMLQANEDFPSVKLFIYLDSDAVVDKSFFNSSVNSLLDTIHRRLPDWDPETRPIVFNQDGPSWWCSLITRIGYKMCLNAGRSAAFFFCVISYTSGVHT